MFELRETSLLVSLAVLLSPVNECKPLPLTVPPVRPVAFLLPFGLPRRFFSGCGSTASSGITAVFPPSSWDKGENHLSRMISETIYILSFWLVLDCLTPPRAPRPLNSWLCLLFQLWSALEDDQQYSYLFVFWVGEISKFQEL